MAIFANETLDDLWQRPGVPQTLANLGLGLMAAGSHVPFGQSRFSMAAPFLQSALRAPSIAKSKQEEEEDRKLQRELRQVQIDKMKEPGVPKFPTYYDKDTGQPHTGMWDPTTRQVHPIGGPKASGSPQGNPDAITGFNEWRLPNSDTVVRGYFDKARRKTFYRDKDGNEVRMPFDARRVTPSSTGKEKMSPKDFQSLAVGLNATEQGIQQITNYFKGVKNANQGLDLLSDRVLGTVRTIFGGVPTAQELTALEQEGRLQGLIGRFKDEIVGPGVMTEQDALRIVSALGGSADPTRNKEVVRRLLHDIISQKVGRYNEVDLPMYNDQVGRMGIYKKKEPIEIPEIFKKPLTPGGLKIGTIEDGYRYIGGDPANPNNWEKLQ